MISRRGSVWVAFGFSVALSVITLLANVACAFAGGANNSGMFPFIAFLPMAFMFAAMSQRQEAEKILALEARIRELEGR